jgi:hypothetical protein
MTTFAARMKNRGGANRRQGGRGHFSVYRGRMSGGFEQKQAAAGARSRHPEGTVVNLSEKLAAARDARKGRQQP